MSEISTHHSVNNFASSFHHANIIHLQQKIDNLGFTRFDFAKISIQPKLKVSYPLDQYEQEADRVADQVMRMPFNDSLIQTTETKEVDDRHLAYETKEKEGNEMNISRKTSNASSTETTDEIANEIEKIHSSDGFILDKNTKKLMESRFGFDFGRVRIHADEKAARSAESVNALAYTIGNSIVFGGNQYRPDTSEGRKLLAHELTHVLQQETIGVKKIQRQSTDQSGKIDEEKKKNTSDVIMGGIKTIVGEAKDDNPKVKKVVIEPLKTSLKNQWERLSTGEKGLTIGFGATMGLTAGPLLFNPAGRKLLEGVNLAAPLQLIPYMPLTDFNYTLPSGKTEDKRLFKFETKFLGDDYLKLLSKGVGLPDISLGINLQWGYDPANDRLKVLGAQAEIGLRPGIKLSVGTYTSLLDMPQIYANPDGSTVESRQRLPEIPKPASTPDTRVMLTVDILKL